MVNLHIDTSANKINCQLELAGETSPIDLSLGYEIQQHASEKMLVIQSVSCSREWIQRIAEDFLPEEKRRIPLPKEAHTILDILKIKPDFTGSSRQ